MFSFCHKTAHACATRPRKRTTNAYEFDHRKENTNFVLTQFRCVDECSDLCIGRPRRRPKQREKQKSEQSEKPPIEWPSPTRVGIDAPRGEKREKKTSRRKIENSVKTMHANCFLLWICFGERQGRWLAGAPRVMGKQSAQ